MDMDMDMGVVLGSPPLRVRGREYGGRCATGLVVCARPATRIKPGASRG